MSRNRDDTSCDCGFRGLDYAKHLDPADPRLKTEAELGIENRYSPHGYGYEERLEDPIIWWTSPDGRCSTTSETYAESDWIVHVQRYARVSISDRYRFTFLECLVCRRTYIGWYVLQPYPIKADGTPMAYDWDGAEGLGRYQLYDTSFKHSYNDEPADEDEANARDITLETISALLDEHGPVMAMGRKVAGPLIGDVIGAYIGGRLALGLPLTITLNEERKNECL